MCFFCGIYIYIYRSTTAKVTCLYMDVSKNSGTPKSSILIGFSIINHPFWGTTILGYPHIVPTEIFTSTVRNLCYNLLVQQSTVEVIHIINMVFTEKSSVFWCEMKEPKKKKKQTLLGPDIWHPNLRGSRHAIVFHDFFHSKKHV